MLTTETKRHIDAARQVLVGVVPNPSSQIDQITNALIYKFMDDMDQSAIKAGGEASFFIKDLEKFSWTRLIDARIGNQERMNIYAEALVKFSEAKQLPELFRNIFKSAFLPYRSPEVLGLFLKEIAYFDYSHPEELGNAYEYLLSIMGSQGDAGQFRTPRHIIDFIVDVVNPTKDDKVLDPACGTAGFLISAYKHILAQHDGQNSDGSKNSEIPLTPDQKRALVNNFEGYDVDPSMVRIAQVNMYLHKFKNPKIVGYNSLSDDERWGDKFDVILANPPFMSPRGGVSIHNKFSLESTKSEVLFVDYIINHLRPKGRAGVIVPEGIIFSSGTAYKQLRKNMLENGLFAVVSLPQGVFNPYAGVKTSILFFDNALAKKTDKILFVRVLNDGFDLGAQRRPIDRNDLVRGEGEMDATKVLKAQQIALETDTVNPWLQENSIFAYEISKGQIEQSGDYGLSAEKYRVDNLGEQKTQKWPIVELGEICEITSSKRVFESEWKSSGVPFYRAREIVKLVKNGIVENELYISEDMYKEYSQKYGAPKENDLMVTGVGTLGICYQVKKNDKFYFKDGNIIWLRNFSAEVDSGFVKNLFESPIIMDQIRASSVGGTVGTYTITNAKKTKIPLPPMEVQMEIIEQIQGKQSAINHAKEIIKELERERDCILGSHLEN